MAALRTDAAGGGVDLEPKLSARAAPGKSPRVWLAGTAMPFPRARIRSRTRSGTILARLDVMNTNTTLVTVRDVVRNATHQLPPDRSMLRVPYDFFSPTGAVLVRDGLATYDAGTAVSTGRVAAAPLADALAGERVLLQLPASAGDEWWLCEIEETNEPAAT